MNSYYIRGLSNEMFIAVRRKHDTKGAEYPAPRNFVSKVERLYGSMSEAQAQIRRWQADDRREENKRNALHGQPNLWKLRGEE